MSFTVLRVPKTAGNQIEVMGEFPNKEGADKFAQETRSNELANEFDYIVETPPSAFENPIPQKKLFPREH